MEKWNALILILKEFFANQGLEIKIVNIPTHPNPRIQYDKYMEVVNFFKDKKEINLLS